MKKYIFSGLNRMKRYDGKYQKAIKERNYNSMNIKKKEESEDTIIRKSINKIINDMIAQNKDNMEIQIFLANKYPNYTEYIIKMIKYHFDKLNPEKLSKDTNNKTGEER